MTARPQPSPAARRTRPPRSSALHIPALDWTRLVLIGLLIGYWVFARELERIEGNIVLANFFFPDLTPSQAAAVTLAPWLTTLIEFFHPLVLRHFIPVFVGWWLAVQAAVSLMQVLYNCPDRDTAAQFLRRQRRNRVSASELPFTVLPHTLEDVRGESILLRVGGPVRVLIPNGYAAVTERNARTLRVLSPGVHDLGRFEYLLGVVDVQPQKREAKDVTMLTKEGVRVSTDMSLTFSIDRGEEPATKQQPYPFNPDAVRQAAYSGTVGANGKVSSWDDGPLGRARGVLGGEVATQTIDELIASDDAHQMLTQTVTRKVWESLPKAGIRPMQLYIGRLTPPPEVMWQYTDYWLATQRKTDILSRANGTQELVQATETARAEGEVMMIHAIIEGTKRAQQEAGSGLSGQLLAARLLEALTQMLDYTAGSLETASDSTEQLQSEIAATTTRLIRLDDSIKHPPAPKFNPSRSD